MTTDEFPPELIRHCGKAAAAVWTSENKDADKEQSGILFQPTAIAVLRASGYAELVAALKEMLERYRALDGDDDLTRQADSALAAAGQPQYGN